MLPRLAVAAVLAGVALALPMPSGGAATPAPAPFESNEPVECLEPTPAAYSVPALAADDVRLDVLVLIDGVAAGRAADVMAKAATSYEPLGIPLGVTYRTVRFQGDTPNAAGHPTGNVDLLFAQMKAAMPGGVRPEGTDLVYLLTDKNLFTGTSDSNGSTPESGRNYSVAGIADCIGGVRFDQHAFAMGEELRSENGSLGPLRTNVNGTAKVAAHELGHLMGAHHHYANCVEGAPTEPQEATVCTLMGNAINVVSLNFSQVNAAIVRGHAERYAAP